MRTRRLALLVIVSLFLIAPLHPEARGEKAGYQPGFVSWRSADAAFNSWDLKGTTIVPGGLQVDSSAPSETDPYAPGAYRGHDYYNGGSYQVGEAVSPEVPLTVPVQEAIASWNAETPTGTWMEMSMRASDGSRWTKWYNLGIWASDTTTVERHSVPLQGDADGFVAIDTLVLGKKFVATALQLKVRLFAATANATPTLRNVGLTYSAGAPRKADASSGDPSLWNVALGVPECSQMVYPDGGTVWCSPTSTSMVLAYWNADTGPCEPRVRAAVSGVYDWAFNGYGNWPFNTAYAAASGFEAYVVRFSSMAQLEPWVKAGVPVVISYAWKGDLTGAPLSSSAGHLAVIVGFDESGNPIVNDPAAANDGDVQRVYLRSELESLWLTHSGGTTYVIFPPGHGVPAL